MQAKKLKKLESKAQSLRDKKKNKGNRKLGGGGKVEKGGKGGKGQKGGAKGGDDGRRWRSYLSGWRWEGLHTMSHDGFGPKSANTKRLQRCSCIHDFWL